MRKIGYFKITTVMGDLKDGVYGYIIYPGTKTMRLVNPVMRDGYKGWIPNKKDIELGFRKGEFGWWIHPDECEILPITPAFKILYGIKE